MTKRERLRAAFTARLTEQLEGDGFALDPSLVGDDPLWRAADSVSDTGHGAVQVIGGVESSPARFEVSLYFAWCIPDVDAVMAEVAPERVTVPATVKEPLDAAIRPDIRRNAGRFAGLTSESDVAGFAEESGATIRAHWSWWVEHFSTLDNTIAYLARDDVAGRAPNYWSGYVLALQHDRLEDAAFFVQQSFAVSGSSRRLRNEYDRVAGFLHGAAEVVGRGSVAVPDFQVLAAAEAQRRAGRG